MIGGSTDFYCVIGDPVSHSLSPFIMNRAFAANGIDAVYAAFRVEPGDVAEAIAGMRALGIRGTNVTFPIKETVLGHADLRSAAVVTIGATNCLTFGEDGIAAENTDAPGVVKALEAFADADVSGQAAVIMGAGGAGRAAAFGLLQARAAAVTLATRTPGRYEAHVARLREAFPEARIDCIALGDKNGLDHAMSGSNLVVNATPLGMGGNDGALPFDDRAITPRQTCFDFVYDPRVTSFLHGAANRGARTLDGLALLVAQAELAFEGWTGHGFDLHEMYEAAVEFLTRREAVTKANE